MADQTPNTRFIEALESIKSIVNTELTLIVQDAQLQTELPEEAFAEKEQETFLTSVRSSLEVVISDIARISQERWQRVETAFPDQFPPGLSSESQTPDPTAVMLTQCPPGFIEVDGICVPI